MTQRKHAYVCVKGSDRKMLGRVVKVSWTTRSERNKAVVKEMTKWARNVWKNQNAMVEISTLDGPTGGLITINGETKPCCKFWLEPFDPTPEPVSALFAAGGAR